MKSVKPSFKIINKQPENLILRILEEAGRVCYKSEHRITEDSAGPFIKMLIKRGHHSVLEHASVSVKITCDRGISHELVRHRICSFSQESTRYANYSDEQFGKEITVIKPFFFNEDSAAYRAWSQAMRNAEQTYMDLLELGESPQRARTVLPNSLKTEIFMTTNIREWRHVFSLRSSWVNKRAHPQMLEIMDSIRASFIAAWPTLFQE